MGWGRCIVFLVALASASPLAAQGGGLVVEWRVAQPFPFFQDDFIYQYHLTTWQSLPPDQRTVGELERRLNDPDRLQLWARTIPNLLQRVPAEWGDSTERAIWYVRRQGWASVTVGRTIWNEQQQRHNR